MMVTSHIIRYLVQVHINGQMDQNILVRWLMDYVMGMVNLLQVVIQLYMRVNGWMDCVMGRGRLLLRAVPYMRGSFSLVINRAKVKWYILHKIIIWVSFRMIKNAVTVQWVGCQAMRNTTVIGVKIFKMDGVHIYGWNLKEKEVNF